MMPDDINNAPPAAAPTAEPDNDESGSLACPHCGQPIGLCVPGEEAAENENGPSWEDDLRHTMSPQNGGGEGGS